MSNNGYDNYYSNHYGLNHEALLASARAKQQIELDKKAAEFAVKQKEKEDEKRKKKIEQWERMQGRGPGHFLGGGASDVRDVPSRQGAVNLARERMQQKHDAKLADWRQRPQEQQVNAEQKLEEQRDAARRMKKVADWERVNGKIMGDGDGQRLGSSHQTNHGSYQGGGACGSNSSNYSVQPAPSVAAKADEITEEKKRMEMRAARLRQQETLNQKVRSAQQSKE